MKKLSILFACAAMSLTLGVAGCKKKKEEAPKADDKAMAKPTDTTTPPPADPGAGKPAAATGDLPAECTEYKTLIEKLASCTKLPSQSRDALKQSFEATSKSWDQIGTMPPEGKTQMASACKTGVDALKQTASAQCGW
jgi:hypothetical protein